MSSKMLTRDKRSRLRKLLTVISYYVLHKLSASTQICNRTITSTNQLLAYGVRLMLQSRGTKLFVKSGCRLGFPAHTQTFRFVFCQHNFIVKNNNFRKKLYQTYSNINSILAQILHEAPFTQKTYFAYFKTQDVNIGAFQNANISCIKLKCIIIK